MPSFKSAWRTARGARPYQEDSVALFPGPSPIEAGLASAGRDCDLVTALADGMGGHAGGAAASRTVCMEFLAAFAAGDEAVPVRLGAGLDAANAAIERAVRAEPAMSGMGSTLIGAAFGASGLQWVSVGDSPLYLLRHGEIALLNEDHSLAPALDLMAATGKITVEQARSDPRRHMLRSAVTGDELDLVDLSKKPLALATGDVVLLASDGIHTLEESEILRVAAGYASDGPEAIADALLRAVEAARSPFQDNISVIVVAVE